MPVEVIMPKVDMDMATGKLSVWHVSEGEVVAKGAPLFDIETDKAAMEVESPATGRLHNILASPGQTVDVGKPVAWIYAEGEAVGAPPSGATAPAAATPVPAVAVAEEPAQPEPATAVEVARAGDGVRATPAARRLARTTGIALGAVNGTGPRGRVQRDDVAAFVAPAAEARTTPAAPQEAPAPATLRGPAGDLAVTTRKGTGTPLVLIHGFAADSFGWMPLESELPRDLPLIRIDLPNHGRSPRGGVRDFSDLARAVRVAFDAAVDGPVHVLAHSLGGAVALALADVRPREIASLTLIAPAGLGPEIDGAVLDGIARASRAESLAPWLKRLTATPDGISWDFARAAMLARNDPAMRDAQLAMADTLFPDGVQSFDLRAALARLTVPTAIIWGRRDHIIPWQHSLSARGEMALHLLHEIGHIPHVECPATVAGILARNMTQASRQ